MEPAFAERNQIAFSTAFYWLPSDADILAACVRMGGQEVSIPILYSFDSERLSTIIPDAEGNEVRESQMTYPPKNVLLFSGHMIDAADRRIPRFPPNKESTAAAAIAQALEDIGAARGDLSISAGACGGDLLFAEACVARAMALELYIPFDEPTFLAKSVDFASGDWRDRFFAVKSKSALHIAPDELGPLSEGENAYERNNQWMLTEATRFGSDRLAFICLWDGQGGDGPGGAQHLMEEARRKTSRIYWLSTKMLWD